MLLKRTLFLGCKRGFGDVRFADLRVDFQQKHAGCPKKGLKNDVKRRKKDEKNQETTRNDKKRTIFVHF